jgi:hypothetical protein
VGGRTDETRRCLNYLRDAARWTVETISPERPPRTSHTMSARSLGLRGPLLCLLQRDGPNGLLWLSVPKVLSQHTASGERANLVALIWPAASSATWLEDRSYRTASGQPGRCACRAIRSPLEGFWVAAPTTEARNILRRGQANRARVRPPAASGSRRFALDVSGELSPTGELWRPGPRPEPRRP